MYEYTCLMNVMLNTLSDYKILDQPAATKCVGTFRELEQISAQISGRYDERVFHVSEEGERRLCHVC